MSSNLFEAVFMNIMVNVITGSMQERIRQTDEMIIPDWMFISNQEIKVFPEYGTSPFLPVVPFIVYGTLTRPILL